MGAHKKRLIETLPMSTITNVCGKKSGRYGHFSVGKYVLSRTNEFVQCLLYNYEICPVQITSVLCNCHTACERDSYTKETYISASPRENLSLGVSDKAYLATETS